MTQANSELLCFIYSKDEKLGAKENGGCGVEKDDFPTFIEDDLLKKNLLKKDLLNDSPEPCIYTYIYLFTYFFFSKLAQLSLGPQDAGYSSVSHAALTKR